MTHVKIAWACKHCGWLQVSDSREHNQQDTCVCQKTSFDLEEGYSRVTGEHYQPLLKQEEGSNEWKCIEEAER